MQIHSRLLFEHELLPNIFEDKHLVTQSKLITNTDLIRRYLFLLRDKILENRLSDECEVNE